MKIRITVKGLVQGIGFRPFVAEQAEKLKIAGYVRNTSGIVTIEAEQEEAVLEEFRNRLVSLCPMPGRIEKLEWTELSDNGEARTVFEIIESNVEEKGLPLLPADLPTCPRCERELMDPGNRRYHHPFISCVACGPRYSILSELPYDREYTTMGTFALCPSCAAEYGQAGNIRRYAQTIACPDCGPQLEFRTVTAADLTAPEADESCGQENSRPFEEGIRLLLAGGILAIKDIGGFHLAARADLAETVSALRQLKGREKKPFALMYADAAAAGEDCEISGREKEELVSAPRPIVLCHKRSVPGHPIAENVCGTSPDIGAMLPCNPLQLLLMKAMAERGIGTLIMTSANASGEPMITGNERLLEWLSEAAEEISVPVGIWQHERGILTPLDDSVVRIVRGRRQLVRRSRGFVPTPVELGEREYFKNRTILSMGGDLKATFAYAVGNRVVLSGQMGDLMEEACITAYRKELTRLGRLCYAVPTALVTDLHPGYVSTELGRTLAGKSGSEVTLQCVQHHMAHVASVIAEHGLSGEVIGIAMDGTGYGTDGTIWGGEVLLYQERAELQRIGHIPVMTLCGGDAGAKNCESMAYALLKAYFEPGEDAPSEQLGKEKAAFFAKATWLSVERYEVVKAALNSGINTVRSTSTGRLFDAVSAILGCCLYNDYEGEAAMELEYLAGRTSVYSGRPYGASEGLLSGEALTGALVRAVLENDPPEISARRFIDAVAGFIYDEVIKAGRLTETKQVALSGGTFLNRLLTEQVIDRLTAAGYWVYLNEQVPTGDGGIALGQAFLSMKE